MKCSTNRGLSAALLSGAIGLGLSGIAQAQDAEEAAAAAEPAAPAWYDNVTLGVFVDSYVALRSDNNEAHDANAGAGNVNLAGAFGHDAYVMGDGFGLAFAGGDLAYSGEEFGATISLRFGPGVNRFYAADMGVFGIDNITQAFVTWKPGMVKGLTLDLGQFGTPFGAEVAESWRNQNYSRGALYYAMQPFWHTGLKANYAINDMFGVTALVVNGVNSAFEGNKSPSLGIQALVTPIDELFIAAGYLTPLHPRDGDEETAVTANFENFFDLVATLTLGDFKLVANADVNVYRPAGADDKENWWGVSLAPGYAITNWFGVAARVEYLSDSANSQLLNPGWGADPDDPATLTTLTGTLDFKPVPNSSALVLRPEVRYEMAGDDGFLDGDNEATDKFWSVHLGAVVTSM
jgi:hypothetical protein